MKNSLPLATNDFRLFQVLLRETSGLHFDEARTQFLQSALWQRLQHRGYESYLEYYNFLKFHPDGRHEMRELLDLITIGETYFFRNKAQFDVLMKSVLPDILRRKVDSGDKCIRVWSAGCSGGDEAYSIAIAFSEAVPSSGGWRIAILGTDINRKGLACAKEAVYGEKSIGYLPKEYVERYFNVRGSTYVLNAEAREVVQFEYHNLARDPLLHEGMQNVDILFCRNVTIYFDLETTRRVIGNFHNCLSREGYLFLGHTETLWQIPHNFERIEFPQTFIYKKRLGPVMQDAMTPFMEIPQPPVAHVASPEKMGLENRIFEREAGFCTREKTEPPVRVRNPGSVQRAGSPGGAPEEEIRASLGKATVLANGARYQEAADLLAKIIEADNLNVEAYYLLGVLCYKNSRLKEAEAQFRKVIYVNPESVLAYYNLGNTYLRLGKLSEAAREFRNAIRLMEYRPREEQIPFGEDFTIEFLLRACRNQLGEIAKRG
jgi:chemotaxis protein methyltransferase CheR